jgi:N-acyl-D-amino-acid deacylase
MYDILIQNGYVVDGSKAPRFKADMAVIGESIAAIGEIDPAQAVRVIDAGDQVVAPGFIDMHSHGDFTLPACPTADSLVYQGVTTAVVGQCGFSLAPLLPKTREEVVSSLETRKMPVPWEKWSDFASYLDFMKALGLSINIVPLVGQGTLRAAVMGFASGPATSEQITAMQALAVKAMNEGAAGISTGLIYPPGSYASTEELIRLVAPAGERRGFYFSHIRGEGETLIEAVAEAIRIGRETGASVEISHLKASWPKNWSKQAKAIELIERAREEGLDVNADVYPYLAGSTGLKSVLPDWAHEGGKASILKRLKDPATRSKMVEDMKRQGIFRDGSWDKIRISRSPLRPNDAGRSVSELAAETGKGPEDWVFDALVETDLDMGMILFMISEDNLNEALKHPAVMIGSDSHILPTEGSLATGAPHPRTFGTFVRVIGHYAREKKVLTLEEAVHKMTGLTAGKLRLLDRGLVKVGLKADLVIFDPETIADRATFDDPFHYPTGISHVICNGREVIDRGRHTGARPGQILGPG